MNTVECKTSTCLDESFDLEQCTLLSQREVTLCISQSSAIYVYFKTIQLFIPIFHENRANKKARNLLHILRYATGSIPRKNPGVPRGLQFLNNSYLLLKGFYTFNEQYLFIFLNFLSKLYRYFQETLPVC